MSTSHLSEVVDTAIPVINVYIIGLLGGNDPLLQTLFLFLVMEMITDMFVRRYYPREEEPEQKEEFIKKIGQKIGIVIIIILSTRIDHVFGVETIRSVCIIFFLINQAFSIVQHIEIMGVPIPKQLKEVLEFFRSKNN